MTRPQARPYNFLMADEPREVFLSLKIEALPEGGYMATSGVIQGLVAQGRTVAETIEIARDVARKLLESLREHGDPIPTELTTTLPAQFPIAVGAP